MRHCLHCVLFACPQLTNSFTDEDKAARQAEKDAEKARKAEEKELAATQKRLQKEEEKQLKEQRTKQDKAWVEEQQRVEEERVAKEKATAADDDAVSPEDDAGESSAPMIKDMRTGEAKDVATTQNQAIIAPLAIGSKNYHGHDGPDESDKVVTTETTHDEVPESSDHARAVAAAVVASPVIAESQGDDSAEVSKETAPVVSDTTGEKVDQDANEPEDVKISSVTSPATEAALAKDSVQGKQYPGY